MAKKRNRRASRTEGLWGSFLFRFGSKLLLILVIVVAFLTMVRCTVKKPQSPQWNTQLTVPLVDRTYPMEELIGKIDQEGLGIDSLGDVTFSITEDLDTVRLEDSLLSTSDLSYVVSKQVGVVSLDPPQVDPVSVSLSSIGGLASSLPGDSAVVGMISFDLYNNMPTVTGFSEATISSGQVAIEVDNGLGVSLDTVIVEIYDVTNGVTVAVDTFPSAIVSGSLASLPVSLDGKTISDSLRVNSHCYTPGGIVDSASTRAIATDLVFPDSLEVSSAVAEVPALSRTFSQQVGLDKNDRIDTAAFSGGTLNLNISNATNLDANVTVRIPDIVSPGGQTLTIDAPISARQNSIVAVDVSGYRLIPSDVTIPQEINIAVTASTSGTSPQHVEINQSDSFFVEAVLSSIAFSSITGVFDTVTASFEGLEQDIDVPTGFDAVEFVSAILTLEIENGVGLPGHLGVRLNGDNGKSLDLSGDISGGGRDSTSLSTISDSTVADFLSPLPSHIDLSGSVTLGDGLNQGTVESNDFVHARVNIFAPLELVINESQIETNIESQKIDQKDIDIITDHIIEGRFTYNIISHLPLGACVNIFLGNDSATLYSDPLKTFDSLFITAAPVSATGIVTDTASTGYQEILLDGADVQRLLKNDTLYVGQELVLEGSGGQVIKLTQDDYITVIGRVEVEYRFDGDF